MHQPLNTQTGHWIASQGSILSGTQESSTLNFCLLSWGYSLLLTRSLWQQDRCGQTVANRCHFARYAHISGLNTHGKLLPSSIVAWPTQTAEDITAITTQHVGLAWLGLAWAWLDSCGAC